MTGFSSLKKAERYHNFLFNFKIRSMLFYSKNPSGGLFYF